MTLLRTLFLGGVGALVEYLSGHVLSCLVPAFFVAGAIQVFLKKDAVLKYLGPAANKFVAYSVAAVSGTVLAVCSCTVLPVFAGIYKRGAGIGPATAFLYSGPAINVLAIVYSARLLGYDIGLARVVAAVTFAFVVGAVMAVVFRRGEVARSQNFVAAAPEENEEPHVMGKRLLLFASLLGLLIFGAAKSWTPAAVFLGFTVAVPALLFHRQDIWEWLRETWHFIILITPWLLGGVFVAGILKTVIPEGWVAAAVGGNTVPANFVASVFGALMYFATLTEVPIVRAFMDMGMAKGPALALLLAGPALSLPNMLVIRSIMGTARTAVYISVVVVMATASGFFFGFI